MKTLPSLALRPASVAAATCQPELPTAASLRAYAFRYLVRGGVTVVAALGQYTLEHRGFAAPWLTWVVLMPAMAVVLSIRDRQLRQQGVAGATSADATLRLLQKSFLLIMLLALGCAPFIGWQNAHPLMLGLYGLTTVAAGRVLHFGPLQVGGVVCGLLGAAAAAVPADTQLLFIAAAMLASYVVPGYRLWAAAGKRRRNFLDTQVAGKQ
ncbi:hypothetical protein [Hymenobacter weizhouensis]|uniref:hypothetical protein n=1 Tax=Hymenobacter sp. YIM 151500-1 TaxID=2987689 RepID=UPI002226AC09|nr:hypothetical protein [Hymenobacter sp. YIM 151500-1]UYZ61679.1 hypothetical protein OIS53_11755 [Hymenobacter sp. YIM 151500-1]